MTFPITFMSDASRNFNIFRQLTQLIIASRKTFQLGKVNKTSFASLDDSMRRCLGETDLPTSFYWHWKQFRWLRRRQTADRSNSLSRIHYARQKTIKNEPPLLFLLFACEIISVVSWLGADLIGWWINGLRPRPSMTSAASDLIHATSHSRLNCLPNKTKGLSGRINTSRADNQKKFSTKLNNQLF